MLSHLFDDKRLTCVLLMVWLCIVLVVFSHLGITNTHFMSFGPSANTDFMGIGLHTWFRWWCVAIFTFVSTSINDFVGDAIVPWIQNTIQDHKSRYIPYSKFMCWAITQSWSFYCCVMGIFSIYLMMSQIDFLIIRAVADGIVNAYTTHRFLCNKKTNRAKYDQWCERQTVSIDSDDEEHMTNGIKCTTFVETLDDSKDTHEMLPPPQPTLDSVRSAGQGTGERSRLATVSENLGLP